MTVSRETVEALTGRYGLPASAADLFLGLLEALAAEPSPPTTVVAPAEAIDVHIADSLSGLEIPALKEATTICDIGAGAGFPGLVLAAALPDARVDLVESKTRKCEVIARLAATAGIDNATAQPVRAEEWGAADGSGRYDVVTARALSSLAVLAEYAAPLLELGGSLVAWKGARDPEEEAAGVAAAEILGLEPSPPIVVKPFKGSRKRNLYVYTKASATPDRFPRRAGMATKRPLAP